MSMSKSEATIARCRRSQIGRLGIVLATLLATGLAPAATPDPALRRSDQIDVRRLGSVSEDERSVLRIEWRAGQARVEESRSVQEMLDKLRRLETGINDVGRLVRAMPVPRPAAPPAPPPPPPPESPNLELLFAAAGMAGLALMAFWWLRRRRLAAAPPTQQVSPPASTTAEPATPLAEEAAQAREAESSLPPAPLPEAAAPPTVPVAPAPTANDAAADSAGQAMAMDPPPAGTGSATVIDFSLEEADPETVARETARAQAVPQVSATQAAAPPPAAAAPAAAAPPAEVEPTLQLAEIMLSMGLEQGAAQALNEYIETHPRDAVYHWLKLLGIYRSRGLKKEFAETAEKLRTHFNIQAEEWGAPTGDKAPSLENFARVAEHVQKLWEQPEACMNYLRHLLEDNRDGERAGFPQSVAEEILFLVEILKQRAA